MSLGLDVVRVPGQVMRARDGTELVADLWHPADGSWPWPALLVRTAYGRAVASAVTAPHPSVLARAGYLVVSQDVRGRGGSDGRFEPFAHEADDGEDAIAWVASLPLCDGRVGTYGFSYQGTDQLLAAARRPPALRAIAPAMCSADPAEGFLFTGGILRLGFAVTWATQLAGADGFLGDGLAALLATRCAAERVDVWPFWDDWVAGRCGSVADVGAIEVPGLWTLGWYDTFSAGTAAALAGFGGPAWVVGGPWWHLPWAPDPGVVTDAHLAFFDEHVAGRPPTVAAPTVRSLPIGAGWCDGAGWPVASAPTRLGLGGRGRAASRWGDGELIESAGWGPADVAVHQPMVPVPSVGGAYVPALGGVGPADQAPAQDRSDVLCYTTPPFPDGTELGGSAVVHLDVTHDAPTLDTCVTLSVVDPDGGARNVAFGAGRAAGARAVTLGPTHAVVPAGHRLRLAVAASAYPELAVNRSAGYATQVTWALHHEPSWLDLPLA